MRNNNIKQINEQIEELKDYSIHLTNELHLLHLVVTNSILIENESSLSMSDLVFSLEYTFDRINAMNEKSYDKLDSLDIYLSNNFKDNLN